MTEEGVIESLMVKHINSAPIEPNTKGDRRNIFLLLLLYTLQGIPIGLSSLSIPIILQNKHKISFNDQAKFSFATWPFCIKLLWAPLVDSMYIRKLGRRKSWLIPVQFSLGILFLFTGFYINKWLITADKPNVIALTVTFFTLNFLTATQDIIVDGWALTMLKRANTSYAAMCNIAGVATGMFLSFSFLNMLMSETFWNKWRSSPQPNGIVSLQEYFYFWGIMYMTVTTLLAIFKTEKDYIINNISADRLSVVKTYKLLFKIVKLPSIKMLIVILLTYHISFSPIEAAHNLKLINSGITEEQIAAIKFLCTPLQICLPFLITKFTPKEKPFKIFFNIIPYRLLFDVVFTLVIFFTPMFLTKMGPLLIAYKICLVLISFLNMIFSSIMGQMIIAFCANISEPKIGGTYMTLLNTFGNIGFTLTKTAALWLIDILTFENCSRGDTNLCSLENDQNYCMSLSGTCQFKIDGFYVEVVVCTIYGVLWYCIFRKHVMNLQSKNVKEWYAQTELKEQSL